MALFCGIFSILMGLIGGILFGIIGGGVAAAMGIIAFILGVKAKKDPEKGNGLGGKVTGIVGLFIGIVMIMIFAGAVSRIKKEAKDKHLVNLEQTVDGLRFGVVGLANKADKLDIDLDALKEEMEQISEE